MNNRIERLLILPRKGNDFAEQFEDCLEQIGEIKASANRQIVQQSFFMDTNSNKEYLERLHLIHDTLETFYDHVPSTSIIAQSHVNGCVLSVELIILTDRSDDVEITFGKEKGIHYTVITSKYCRELYAGGITVKAPHNKFIDQVQRTYALLQTILEKESFLFSDIVRQWNYVEQIFSVHEHNGEQIQNYQVLNDIRSQYYAKADFVNGYPAATGIGMNFGGLVLEIYAVKPFSNVEIMPLKNPNQVDAYSYSDVVLVGGAIEKKHKKTTPKFERAKYISINGVSSIFISGTASIQNERTIGVNDPSLQTKITLENIDTLISKDNLLKTGIQAETKTFDYSFIRVYIKNSGDYGLVRKICDRYFGNIPIHYLIADVCRETLLLEIEGVANAC